MSWDLDRVLDCVRADERERVEGVVKQYRDRVNTAVSSAASLAMRRVGRQHQVQVDLVSGAPSDVHVQVIEDDLGTQLSAYRGTLAQGLQCLEALVTIDRGLEGSATSAFRQLWPRDASDLLHGFLEELVQRIDKAKVIDLILKYSMDPLGRYRPGERRGSIGVYWQMIAMTAPRLGVSVEALTLKVLAHESAHAVSQLGMDADGMSWEPDQFLRADTYVQEGLANYWSYLALSRMDDWLAREALRALDTMWPLQPPPYGEFNRWRDRPVKAEDVRFAVIAARQLPEIRIGEFRAMLSLPSD